jgi:hypothetical protein
MSSYVHMTTLKAGNLTADSGQFMV